MTFRELFGNISVKIITEYIKMPNMTDITITPDMLKKIAEIDAFNGAFNSGGIKIKPDKLKAMKRIATIESIGSSNRIEGNKLNDKVNEFLEKTDGTKSHFKRAMSKKSPAMPICFQRFLRIIKKSICPRIIFGSCIKSCFLIQTKTSVIAANIKKIQIAWQPLMLTAMKLVQFLKRQRLLIRRA